MKLLRILLLPLSLLYGGVVYVRNKFYDWNILSISKPSIATISVGNLSVGGTGKTPHIEYLIQLLKTEFYIATLSRGYGRKTEGFLLADTQSVATDIGDEPMQFKKKFPRLRIAVDTDRVRGVKLLVQNYPSLQAVLLDDAFQHRAIKTGLSILLTDFSNLFTSDYLLPTGNLREFGCGYKRADIIIVTKCQTVFLPIERKRLIDEIKPTTHQQIYFSYLKYGDFISLYSGDNAFTKEYYYERGFSILLVTGIANSTPLEYYIKSKVRNVEQLKFPDHHQFKREDMEKIRKKFTDITSANKLIVTTEKDTMRFRSNEYIDLLKGLPIFYLPIEIVFHDKDKISFDEQILNYVRSNQKTLQ
ncbi:MAG: tetraacyldisaccharide 4'-kinase [Bacteroidia bacterium]